MEQVIKTMLSTIDWSAFEDAIEEASRAQISKTLEECLQDAVIQALFPGANEALTDGIRTHMIKLLPLFRKVAHEQIARIFAKDYNAPRDSREGKMWADMKRLIRLAYRIADLPDSVASAMRLLIQVMTIGLPYIWPGVHDHGTEMLLLLDEAALSLCKRLPDVAAMRYWRNRLTTQRIYIGYSDRDYMIGSMLLRAKQYLTDRCTRQIGRCIVDKIAEGRLPMELADLIIDQVLVDRDVPVHEGSIWAARKLKTSKVLAQELKVKATHCCPLLKHDSTPLEEMIYWSTAERRYIRFHKLKARALLRYTSGAGKFTAYGEGVYGDDDIVARCRGPHGDKRNPNRTMVYDGPHPGWESDFMFESDHGVERGWENDGAGGADSELESETMSDDESEDNEMEDDGVGGAGDDSVDETEDQSDEESEDASDEEAEDAFSQHDDEW